MHVNYRKLTLFLSFLLSFQWGLAAPESFTFQGQIIKPDGQALEGTNVQFTIELLAPGLPDNTPCVLYSEEHTLNMQNSNGVFSVEVGSGSSISSDYAGVTTIGDALGNGVTITAVTGGCVDYIPTLTDGRQLRLTFDDGTSGPITITQNHDIVSVPFAYSAASINGLTPADLLNRDTSGSNVLTQANLVWLFETTRYTELQALINGTSTQYLSGAITADLSLGTNRITNLGAPTAGTDAANRDYVDQNIGGNTANIGTLGPGNDGQVLTWDGSAGQFVASLPTTIDATKLPLAGGTMTGPIDMGAQDITNGNNVTIGGNMIATGGISTSGTLAFYNASDYVGFQAGASPSNQIWVLPDSDGTNGQVLTTDGSGNLAWSTASSPVTTVFGRAGAVVAQASDYTAIQIDNTPGGDISATSVQGAINELDTEKVSRAGDNMTGALTMDTENEIRFADNAGGEYVGFKAPNTVGASYVLELPAADGTSGQALVTNGSGALSFASVLTTETQSMDDVYNNGSTVTVDTTDVVYNITGSNNFQVQDGGTTAFVVDGSGNVGVGTSTPGAILEIQRASSGPAQSEGSSSLKISNSADPNKALNFGFSTVSDFAWIETAQHGTSWETPLVINARGGNVAIGTDNPSGKLDIEGGDVYIGSGTLTNTSGSEDLSVTGNIEADGTIYGTFVGDGSGLTNVPAAAGTILNDGNSGAVTIGTNTLNALGFETNNVEQMNLTTNGNLIMRSENQLRLEDGVGGEFVSLRAPNDITTSYNLVMPASDGSSGQVLSTNGSGFLSWVSPSSGSGDLLNGGNSGAVVVGSNDNTLELEAGGSTAITVNLSGQVGIGTSTPNQALDVEGSINATQGFRTTSANGLIGDYAGNMSVRNTSSAGSAALELTGGNNAGSHVTIKSTTNTGSGDYVNIVGGTNGATEIARFLGNGRVGIGTTTPTRFVSIHQVANDGAALSLETPGVSGNQTAQLELHSQANGNILGTSAGNKGWQVFTRGNAFSTAGERNDFGIVYWNGSSWTNAFSIDSLTGNIGIGTLGPNGKLDVDGDIRMRGATSGYAGFQAPAVAPDLLWTLPTADGTSGQVLSTDGSGNLAWIANGAGGGGDLLNGGNSGAVVVGSNDNTLVLEASGTTAVTILGNGNVGIGSSTPDVELDVVGTGTVLEVNNGVTADSVLADFNGTVAVDELSLYGGSGRATNLRVDTVDTVLEAESAGTGDLIFQTNSAERMRINSSGFVGIGTTNPDTILDVRSGTTSTGSETLSTAVFEVSPSGATTGNYTGHTVLSYSDSPNTSGAIVRGVYAEARSANLGNIGTAVGLDAFIFAGDFGGGAATINNGYGVRVLNSINVGSTINRAAGAAVLEQTGATNNTNLLLGASTIPTGNFSIYNASTNPNFFAGDTTFDNETEVRFEEATGSGDNYVGFKAPATLAGDVIWTLPIADGTSGQVLSTDGSGNLAWIANGAGGGGDLLNGGNSGAVVVGSNDNTLVLEASGTTAVTILGNGNVGIGSTAPSSELEINDIAPRVRLSSPSLTHGMTALFPTDVGLELATLGSNGAEIIGNSGNASASGMTLYGTIGSTTPTATVPAVKFHAAKANGGSWQALAATETAFQFNNRTSSLLTIMGDGDVGIGTNSPGQDLSLYKNANDSLVFSMENPNSGNLNQVGINLSNDLGVIGGLATHGSSFALSDLRNRLRLATDISNSVGLDLVATGSGQDLRIFAGGSSAADEQIRVNNSGVGVGTNSPSSQLHVRATNNSEVGLIVSGAGGAHTGDLLRIEEAVGVNRRLTLTASGRMAIGDSAPGGKLDVDGDIRMLGSASGYVGFQAPATAGNNVWTLPTGDGTSGQALVTDGSGNLSFATVAGGGGDLLNGGNSGAVVVGSNDNSLSLEANGSTAMTINNSGYVGIGTISPANVFQVRDTITAAPTAATMASFSQTSSATSGNSIAFSAGVSAEPASPSTGTYMSMQFGTSTQSANMTGATIEAFRSNPWVVNTGNVGTVTGGKVVPTVMNLGGGSPTVDDLYGLNISAIISSATVNNYVGVDISENSDATNSTNLLVGRTFSPGPAPTGEYSIYNVSTRDNYFEGSLGIGTDNPGGKLDVDGDIRMLGSASGYVGFQAPATAGNNVWTLPTGDGTSGQVLQTDGSGNLSWTTASGGYTDGDVILAASGTNSAPGLSFDTDTDTGIYNRTADALAITIGGERMAEYNSADGYQFFSSNNTDLDPQFHGYGTGPFDGINLTLTRSDGGNNGGSRVLVPANNKLGAVRGQGWDGSNYVTGAEVSFYTDGATGVSDMPGRIVFNTTADGTATLVERMLIDNQGNVGIGSSAPAGKLDVDGDIRMLGSTSGYAGFQAPATAGNNVWTLPTGDGTSGQALITDGSGNLSFSTITGGGGDLLNGGNSGAVVVGSNDNTLELEANGSTAMTINNSGYVGIGTTTPTHLLEIIDNTGLGTRIEASYSTTGGGSSSGLSVSSDATPSGASTHFVRGIAGSASTSTTNTSGANIGGGFVGANVYNGGSVDKAMALQATNALFNSGAGATVNDLYGVSITDTISTPGSTVTNFAGVSIKENNIATNKTNLLITPPFGDSYGAIPAGTFSIYNSSTEENYFEGSLGIGTSAPGGKLDVDGDIRMLGSTSGYAGFRAPATAGNTLWTLPTGDGTSGQVLSTDGSGNLSWVAASSGTPDEISDNDNNTRIQVEESTDENIIRFDVSNTEIMRMESDAVIFNRAPAIGTFNMAIPGSDLHDLDTGGAGLIYLQSTADLDLTGLDSTSVNAAAFQIVKIVNSGTGTITLREENGSSLAVNRFTIGGDLELAPNDSVEVMYDSIDDRWRTSGFPRISGVGDILNGGNTTGADVTIGTNDGFDLNFETNGSTAMTISASGRVAVGTTTPLGILHVRSAGSGAGAPPGGRNNFVIEDNGSMGMTFISPNTSRQTIAFGDPESFTAGYIDYDHGSDSMGFRVNSSVAMTINSSGYVGIGTTTPSSQFVISSDVPGVKLINTGISHGMTALGETNVAGNFFGGSNGGLYLTGFSENGSSPGMDFQGFIGNTTVTAGTSAFEFKHAKKDGTFVQALSGSDIGFKVSGAGFTTPAQEFFIMGDGDVGIGTDAPGGKLDVNGDIRMLGSTSGYVGFQAPAVGPDVIWTLPTADGTSGQVLSTDGSGNLSWAAAGGGYSSGDTIVAAQGDGSNPSFTFTGDTDTGLFRWADGRIGFTNNGVNAGDLSSSNLTLFRDIESHKTDGGKLRAIRIDSTPNTGEVLGVISFGNSSEEDTASVSVQAAEDWTSGVAEGTNMIFSTTANGAATPTERLRIDASGNVGIGTTTPEAELDLNTGRMHASEICDESGGNCMDLSAGTPDMSCPTGFTKVASMGCIQDDEEGSGTWFVASNTCYTNHGGRLPQYSEWYIAMNNFTLTDETDDHEWMNNFSSSTNAVRAGNGGITNTDGNAITNTNAYRCWIPLPR